MTALHFSNMPGVLEKKTLPTPYLQHTARQTRSLQQWNKQTNKQNKRRRPSLHARSTHTRVTCQQVGARRRQLCTPCGRSRRGWRAGCPSRHLCSLRIRNRRGAPCAPAPARAEANGARERAAGPVRTGALGVGAPGARGARPGPARCRACTRADATIHSSVPGLACSAFLTMRWLCSFFKLAIIPTPQLSFSRLGL